MGTNYPAGGVRNGGGEEGRTIERIGDSDRPSAAIVEAVGVATDRHPLELRPLYRVLEPDAVDALFRGPEADDVVLQFEYEGCRVRVESDRVVARPASDDE